MINVLERIMQYRLERNWTEYQLAEKSNLPQSTISSWYRKNQIPTIQSLEKICQAFNITLAQFFTEKNSTPIVLTDKQKALIDNFNKLNQEQQKAVLALLATL
ncbi:MAG: helix-turn-helix transcriptional regulator [Spirochaetia bacterium]|nr:helix-turn-helix transcriptional regulator [Spirochaetia bacterium]